MNFSYKALRLNLPTLPQFHFTSKTNPINVDIYQQPLRNKSILCCTKWNHTTSIDQKNEALEEGTHQQEEQNKRERERERPVQCEVEVVSWRERRIRADISVNADIDSVWSALTDYERLADFIPNLISSGRIPCPHPGRIWLEQRGLQGALYWHIEAQVVLDLQEFLNSASGRELHFSMVDGDFKKFEGKWSLQSGERSFSTILSYEVSVIPRFNFPAILLERIVRSDLPVNLRALACRAEKHFEGNQRAMMAAKTTSLNDCEKDEVLQRELSGQILEASKESSTSSSFASPLPASSSSEVNGNWGVFGKVCRLDKPYCMVDEVHLRRFDGLLENGGVHRCVVATITVKAPVREVWNVLTAYESLPEIVPNLAISKILSRENNKVRILQEGCKGLLYMVLHARVVLDLCEHLEQEVSFEQVEGDFDSFRGKWLLEQLGNRHTLLKYSVESKMHKDTFLSESIMEEVVYEDLPSNLSAIRDYIERRRDVANSLKGMCNENEYSDEEETDRYNSTDKDDDDFIPEVNETAGLNGQSSVRPRPRIPGLQRDIEVLKAELLKFIAEHGQEGFMPMRKQLRLHGRVDIEKGITRMGGFRRIATLMNLSLAYKHRKPKGYWDKLDNLQDEISRFQRSWGMDLSFMPSRKSFERAGRYDIARALEKWGGLHEVSRLLSLKVRHPNRQGNLGKEKKTDSVVPAGSTDVEEEEEEEGESGGKTPSGTCVSQDTEKWLAELQHLDISWVE